MEVDDDNDSGAEAFERPCDGQVDNFVMVPPEYAPRPLVQEPPAAVAEMTRWPQMTTLIRDHEDAVLKILNACDECEVVNEVAASDSGNVKGNKWVRLHDVVFGGQDDSTGGLIPEFPVIPFPSKFKKKVVSIWTYGLDATRLKFNEKGIFLCVTLVPRNFVEFEEWRPSHTWIASLRGGISCRM